MTFSLLGSANNLPFTVDRGSIVTIARPVGYTASTRSTGTGSLGRGTVLEHANDTGLACLLRR